MLRRSRAPQPRALVVFAALAAPSLAGLLAARPAGAAEPATAPSAVRLVWVRGERTENCDDRAGIARRVSARLGRDVFSDAAPRAIEGVVQHDGEHWAARLYLRDADGALVGSRNLTSDAPDCEPLEAAVTLAIALAIDPDAALRAPPTVAQTAPPAVESPRPAPAPIPPTAPPAAPPPAAAPSPFPVPNRPQASPEPLAPARSPRRDGVRVTARGVIAAGLLPSASPGFAWSAETPAGRVVLGTAGVLYLPETRTAEGDFAFGLTLAWLGACAQAWGERAVSLAVCGKVLLGAIHAVVYKLEPTEPGDRIWSGASLAGQARFRIVGPLVVELGAEMVVPFTRSRFMVSGGDAPVFQESAVGAVGFAGLGLSIP
jgi:hypothetical protein